MILRGSPGVVAIRSSAVWYAVWSFESRTAGHPSSDPARSGSVWGMLSHACVLKLAWQYAARMQLIECRSPVPKPKRSLEERASATLNLRTTPLRTFSHFCPPRQVGQDGKSSLSTKKFSKTRVSISLFQKVWNALAGVLTMGSPLRLNEVLSTTGTPVAWPKLSIKS